MIRFANFAFKQARKNIRRNALILAITCGGFVSISILHAFSNSIINYQKDINIYTLISDIQIHKNGFVKNKFKSPLDYQFEDNQNLRNLIYSVPHVKGLAPRIIYQGVLVETLANQQQKNEYSDAMGIDCIQEVKNSFLFPKWLFVSPKDMHLSSCLLKENEIILTNNNRDIFTNKNKELPLFITTDADGLYSAEIVKPINFFKETPPYEKNLMTLDFARKLLKLAPHQIVEYGVNIDEESAIEEVKKQLQNKIGDKFEVHTWYDIYPILLRAQNSEKFLFNIINYLLISITLLANYAVIFMILNDRKSELGIMTSIGIPFTNLRRTYLIEGLFIGLWGTSAGFILSLIILKILNIFGINFYSSDNGLGIKHQIYLHPQYGYMTILLLIISILIGVFYDIRFHIFSKISTINLLKKL